MVTSKENPGKTNALSSARGKETFFAPAHAHKSFLPPVQRKCAGCEEEEKVQRKESGQAQAGAPSIVHDVVNSGSGKKLDHDTQAFMQDRFGYNFSHVKIHTGNLAAKSAASVNALAYTSGNNVVFNEGQYSPSTADGKKLLAHELTHVVQQEKNTSINGLQRQPAVTPRGTNPADCMGGICSTLNGTAAPASVASAQRLADNWLRDTLNCLRTDAPNSNASHQAEIVQNEETELRDEAASARDYFSQIRPSRSSFRDFIANLRRECERKSREIGIEFRYNIVFDNSGAVWGYHPSTDWDAIESAFATMPAEATWLSPRLLTFRREHVHATQPSVAGETDLQTGNITIFDHGFGSAPYGRSAATGIPSTTQTIQHEVGHVMVEAIPRSDYNDFFENIVHWHRYSWSWITTANSPFETWRAERNALLTETGMTAQQLDAWLPTLALDARTDRGDRSYFRTSNFLEAYDRNQVSAIPAFEYAATNRDDYLSELYTFCISSPEFVHQHLPRAQINWLKRVVFHFPTDPNEILRLYAIGEPQQTEFIRRISRLFTWEQVDAVFNQVMSLGRSGGNSAIA